MLKELIIFEGFAAGVCIMEAAHSLEKNDYNMVTLFLTMAIIAIFGAYLFADIYEKK